jgi:hypothetical protein
MFLCRCRFSRAMGISAGWEPDGLTRRRGVGSNINSKSFVPEGLEQVLVGFLAPAEETFPLQLHGDAVNLLHDSLLGVLNEVAHVCEFEAVKVDVEVVI